MKRSTLVKSVSVLALLGVMGSGAYYLKPLLSEGFGQEEVAPPVVPGSYIGNTVRGSDWLSPRSLRDDLAQRITQRLQSTKRHDVLEFLKNKENRLLLAQWQLAQYELDSAGAAEDKTKKIQKELENLKSNRKRLKEEMLMANSARTKAIQTQLKDLGEKIEKQQILLDEVQTIDQLAKDPKGAAFLEQVTNNLDWMEQILYTGECRQPGRAIALMYAMMQKTDPQIIYNQLERDTVTATALEFALNGWTKERALDRADYFVTSWRANRLNTLFDTLPFWHRRIVTGAKGENQQCFREAFEWALDNVHLPAEKYDGCCWRNGYKLYNLFGESIHGSGYWEPFNGLFNNAMLFTNQVGGVCGALSHFGAYAACANGVPAMTAGEPGHCAFVLRIDKRWQPSYSLTWERSLHWTPWQNTWEFSSLHMADKFYSTDEVKRTLVSNAYVSLARMYETLGGSNQTKALSCFSNAVAIQPCNYVAWRAYSNFLRKTAAESADAWLTLNTLICRQLAPEFPEMASQILSAHVYGAMNKALQGDESARLNAFAQFWKAVEGMGPDRWRIEKMMDTQLGYMKKDNKLTDDQRCDTYRVILQELASKPVYAPVVLGWGSKLSSQMSQEGQRKFMAATLKSISGNEDMKAEDRDRMLGQALRSAELMRDMTSFQSIAALLSQSYKTPKDKLPKFEAFPGRLVSEGGLLYLSSYDERYDNPCAHPGVLSKAGGYFHTGWDDAAWATVELPRLVEVTGVVVVCPGQHMGRLHGMRIQVSETGKDGEWKDVGKPVENVKQRVNRYDLQQELPRARFIRVLRPEPANFFHLNGIYVYGRQAS